MIRHRVIWQGKIGITIAFAILWCSDATALPPNSAYIANIGDDTVSVLSLESRQVLATIDVGDSPTAVVASPNGSRVYVANNASNNVSVIDTLLGTVIQTIPVGTTPTRLAVNRDGSRVYVANCAAASMSVIDTSTNAVLNTVLTPPNPNAIAFHPNRDEIWLGFDATPDVLQVRSANDFSVLATTSTFSRPYGSWDLEFRPDGSEVFGAEGCGDCGRFHRIDGDLPITILQQDIVGGGFAIGLAMNPLNDTVYLAKHGGPPRIVEFGGLGRTRSFASPVRDVVASPDGSLLLVSHGVDPGIVSFVDAATLSVIDTVQVGAFPERMAIAIPEPATVWLTLAGVCGAVLFYWRLARARECRQ